MLFFFAHQFAVLSHEVSMNYMEVVVDKSCTWILCKRLHWPAMNQLRNWKSEQNKNTRSSLLAFSWLGNLMRSTDIVHKTKAPIDRVSEPICGYCTVKKMLKTLAGFHLTKMFSKQISRQNFFLSLFFSYMKYSEEIHYGCFDE